jgi:hypothetical protein
VTGVNLIAASVLSVLRIEAADQSTLNITEFTESTVIPDSLS